MQSLKNATQQLNTPAWPRRRADKYYRRRRSDHQKSAILYYESIWL